MEGLGLSQVAVAGIISLVLIVCFGILSAVLDHHWSSYEIDLHRRRKVRGIYYTGAGIILAFMLITFISLLL
jgi:multisubunit Na+/H+ antiporter MnhB subunit